METDIENLPVPQSTNPLELISRMATDPSVDADKLEKLLAVKKDWEADEARKAFATAIAKFQSECPIIEKADSANGKAYAKLDRIWREIRPLMRECKLSLIWTQAEIKDGQCVMRGLLTHEQGHSIDISRQMAVPSMPKGTNESQRDGSAITYCKRYGTCDVLGIITGDDDDGSAGQQYEISVNQFEKLESLIAESGADRKAFMGWVEQTFNVTALEHLSQAAYPKVEAALNRKIKASK